MDIPTTTYARRETDHSSPVRNVLTPGDPIRRGPAY
jgi:hypothetical protein